MASPLRVVLLKPSKYAADGSVERFRRGFMPNSTVPHLASMTLALAEERTLEVHSVDEYVHTDLDYLSLLKRSTGGRTLLALVGVQSHQLHRALDLAAYAVRRGCQAVIGGPHAMTCDTSSLRQPGISFALAEAELVWSDILHDAAAGELRPVYGATQRWQQELESPVVAPPSRSDLRRYIVPMLGLYPARGCPFRCNFCSVIKIAGRRVRGQSVGTTLASLRAAKQAGVRTIMFTSDNFNKYSAAEELLQAMIDERLQLELFVQCDTQIARQERLVSLLAEAGCFQIFVGVESFNRETLLAAAKGQNRPESYREIVRLCRHYGIGAHFSTILGFPHDTPADVEEHRRTLCQLSPACASFYLLCPIPGTEQYDDFLAQGLLTATNLDRFDATSLTWRHPHFTPEQLEDELYRCYRSFFSGRHLLQHVNVRSRRAMAESARNLASTLFSRYSAWRRQHPMSGGVARVKLDSASDYLPQRRATFGFELAPLPRSLPLSAAEALLQP